jgi:cell division protein FtsQ
LATSKQRRRRRRPASAGRRHLIRRVLANGAAVGAILTGAWGAVNSPVFQASDLRVSGGVRLSPGRIEALAGVDATTNVVRLSTEAVERRLEADPWIEDAEVSRVLPSTIRIVIRERRALAAVRSGGRWGIVAGDGTVLRFSARQPALPVLEGVVATAIAVGGSLRGAEDVLGVLRHLPQGLGPASARFVAGGVQIRLPSGARILYGDRAEWRAKNAALTALLRWARGQGREAAVLDVRVPNAPALRLVAV